MHPYGTGRQRRRTTCRPSSTTRPTSAASCPWPARGDPELRVVAVLHRRQGLRRSSTGNTRRSARCSRGWTSPTRSPTRRATTWDDWIARTSRSTSRRFSCRRRRARPRTFGGAGLRPACGRPRPDRRRTPRATTRRHRRPERTMGTIIPIPPASRTSPGAPGSCPDGSSPSPATSGGGATSASASRQPHRHRRRLSDGGRRFPPPLDRGSRPAPRDGARAGARRRRRPGNQIVEDLGVEDLASTLTAFPERRAEWLARAADAAASIASIPDPGINPPFDAALFRRELDLAREAVFDLCCALPSSASERDGARRVGRRPGRGDSRAPRRALPSRLSRQQPLRRGGAGGRHRLPGPAEGPRLLRPGLAPVGAIDARLDDRGARAPGRSNASRRPGASTPRGSPTACAGCCCSAPGRSAGPSPGRSPRGAARPTAGTSRRSWPWCGVSWAIPPPSAVLARFSRPDAARSAKLIEDCPGAPRRKRCSAHSAYRNCSSFC